MNASKHHFMSLIKGGSMEIERKFIVDQIPSDLDIFKNSYIEQGYLSIIPEVRIRMLNDKCFLTVKSSGTLSRDEYETEISLNTYNDFKKKLIGESLIKQRHYINIGEYVAELDIYENLKNLKVVEVEFMTVDQAIRFKIPNWFGKEVTYDESFKNKNLFKIIS